VHEKERIVPFAAPLVHRDAEAVEIDAVRSRRCLSTGIRGKVFVGHLSGTRVVMLCTLVTMARRRGYGRNAT
jgi:hypothetical protein